MHAVAFVTVSVFFELFARRVAVACLYVKHCARAFFKVVVALRLRRALAAKPAVLRMRHRNELLVQGYVGQCLLRLFDKNISG